MITASKLRRFALLGLFLLPFRVVLAAEVSWVAEQEILAEIDNSGEARVIVSLKAPPAMPHPVPPGEATVWANAINLKREAFLASVQGVGVEEISGVLLTFEAWVTASGYEALLQHSEVSFLGPKAE